MADMENSDDETAPLELEKSCAGSLLAASSFWFRQMERKLPVVHTDDLDWSEHPSYSRITEPYAYICRTRYLASKDQYNAQFVNEVSGLINAQPSALEAMRLHKHLVVTTLWPPMHNRFQVESTMRNFFPQSPRHRSRIAHLLVTKMT